MIDYEGFLQDQAKLENYLSSIERLSVEEFADYSREDRMALWINAYNASVIQLILKHYPVDSIQKIHGFWDDKVARIAGMTYSLGEIRDKVFRQGFRDERATLALISGTKSSGPLRNEPYVGNKLTEQLKDQMAAFLSDERFNRIKINQKKLLLSPLFKELADDFILGYSSSDRDSQFSPQEFAVLSFIRIHLADSKLKDWIKARKYKIRFLPYDWSLNRKS